MEILKTEMKTSVTATSIQINLDEFCKITKDVMLNVMKDEELQKMPAELRMVIMLSQMKIINEIEKEIFKRG